MYEMPYTSETEMFKSYSPRKAPCIINDLSSVDGWNYLNNMYNISHISNIIIIT